MKAIEQTKRYLIEALSALNEYPAPSTQHLAAAILWIGRAVHELGKADPNDEALTLAEGHLHNLVAKRSAP